MGLVIKLDNHICLFFFLSLATGQLRVDKGQPKEERRRDKNAQQVCRSAPRTARGGMKSIVHKWFPFLVQGLP